MTTHTRLGLRKGSALRSDQQVRLLAPASGFDREEFERGVQQLRAIGLQPAYDDRVFERQGYVAGSAESRATQLREAWADPATGAILAVRGGYGSVQVLPRLRPQDVGAAPLVGYSDITSLHIWLNCQLGMTSIHGPMIDRKVAAGPSAYDTASFLGSLTSTPLGEMAVDGLETVVRGDATGPLYGGTISQLLGSLGTPYAFEPPAGCLLWLDEVGERPYRLDRMMVQLRQSGVLSRAAGVLVGQLPHCDEADGRVRGWDVVADALRDVRGPVVMGFPSGHTTTKLYTLPLGVDVRLAAGAGQPAIVIEESPVA
ncbi:MAG: putative carboxypeptidase [Acidimicrobiia bacterium]